MSAAPVPESTRARQPEEESTAAAGGLGGSEQLAPAADKSATIPKATARTVRSSGAEVGVAGDTPESRAAKPVAAEEQTAPPEASPGMVGPAVRPWSPPMVPRATTEEDEVEEIERAEPQLQSVQILRKRGDEVVVIKEEDTTREMKRLISAVVGVMKQIEVSTAFGMLDYVVGDQSSSLALYICRGKLGLPSSGTS